MKVSPAPEDPVVPVGPVVADLVCGLRISCENEDFHCPDQCDNPESHMENLPKTEPESEPVQNPNQLLVKLLDPAARLPTRATSGSAGYDLYCAENTLIVPPGTRRPVNTGIAIAIPQGTYARIAPRSGLSVKGLDIGAGVVDSDYRGPIKAVLINNSEVPFQIYQGD